MGNLKTNQSGKGKIYTMPNYMDAVKARLAQLNNNYKPVKAETEKAKFPFFKPQLGEKGAVKVYDVRFLPYADKNGQPFEEVMYYNNIADSRVIAPVQYGLVDPIDGFLRELLKETKGFTEQSKAAWKQHNSIKAKPRFYAVILVRGEEDKGPQVWEFSSDVCKKIYNQLTDKDYVDEDLLSVETGYDFAVTVSAVAGKTFNGYPVKEFDIKPRRKASKLGTKDQVTKWMAAVPNLAEYFQGFAPNEEKAGTILENFMNGGSKDSADSSSTGRDHNASRGATVSASDEEVEKSLDEVFGSL